MPAPAEDVAPLALVMDDCYAPAILAWWDKVGFMDPAIAGAAVACQSTHAVAEDVIARCKMAGLLTDTGITPLARKFVQTEVSKRLKSSK